jgi:hypothetical protein
MSRSTLLALIALAAILAGIGLVVSRQESPPSEAPTASEPAIRAVGLMVNAPVLAAGGGELAFPITRSRTSVALELVFPAGELVGLVPAESDVRVFRDDLGLDLRRLEGFGSLDVLPRIAPDRGSMVFLVSSDRAPTSGATALELAGSLSMLVAHERTLDASEPTPLVPDALLETGPIAWRVVSCGPSRYGAGWSLELETDSDPGSVHAFALRTESGARHELTPLLTINGAESWTLDLICDVPVAHGSLEVERWQEPERVVFRFEARVALGL